MDKSEYNFYSLKFTNNEEKFVRTELFTKTDALISSLQEGMLASSFIKFKQINTERERNPVYYSKSTLMSIEKVSPGIIGTNTKLWEIIK